MCQLRIRKEAERKNEKTLHWETLWGTTGNRASPYGLTTTSVETLFLLLAAGSSQALTVMLSHRRAPPKTQRGCPASLECLWTAGAWPWTAWAWPSRLQVRSSRRVVPGPAHSWGIQAGTSGRASCITSSSKAAGGNRMDKPSLAWGRDDTTAAPAAWVAWSQRVPAAPGETGTQDQGTDGARRPRAGRGVSPQHHLPDKTSVCR